MDYLRADRSRLQRRLPQSAMLDPADDRALPRQTPDQILANEDTKRDAWTALDGVTRHERDARYGVTIRTLQAKGRSARPGQQLSVLEASSGHKGANLSPKWGVVGDMKARFEDVAGMALAGGWLVAFTITAGIANRVRPYRRRVQEEWQDHLDLETFLAGSRRGLALAR